MRGKFITLEGIEGSGKSTSLDTISKSLENLNIEFIVTKEPGGGPLGKDLRKMLLDKKTSISSEVELLLMMADRKNHIENIVEPSLEKGIWVISDRYLDSSYAYQGGGRQIEVSKIDLLTELLKLPIPDLTLLFDLSPEIALQRAKNRSELDRFESEPIDFHQRIREAYLTLANDNIQRFNVIDASKDIQNVKDQVQKKLNQFIN
jgi:dTMP kinase